MTLVGLAARKLSLKKRNAKLAAAFPQGVRCQKCLEFGHWSFECKETKRKYVQRPSRSRQLKSNLAEKNRKDTIEPTVKEPKAKRAKHDSVSESSGSSSNSDSDSSSESESTDSDDDSSSSDSSSSYSSSSSYTSDSSSSSEEEAKKAAPTSASSSDRRN